MSDDDLDLAALPDDELVTQMHEDLYDGLAAEIAEGTMILLDRGWAPDKVLNDALVEGMRIVGIDFRDGILFAPEVLLSANAMKAGMEILRPLLAETQPSRSGKVVIGTVKGDPRDGKNLVAMMLEGAGFEVIDLGINTDADSFLGGTRGAPARHPRDVRAAHHHHALHEGGHRHAPGAWPPREVRGPGRRRAAQRGVRPGDRRRRVLP
ncbi:MAG: B12-binding domain-containing protein [Ilumatobacteraceae bacterium]